jgi:chemotaxis protein CheX
MMDETVIPHLVKATQEVFETMVFKSLEPGDPVHGLAATTEATVVASIGFAGQRSGLIAFHSSADTAKEIAGSMLGIPAADVDGEMADAMGEVANMIAGGFRLKLKGDGTDVAISVPTVITGSDFHTRYVTPVTRVLCPFRFDGGSTVFVELIVNQ